MQILDPTPKSVANHRFGWEPLKIVALGDVQYGSAGCDIPRLKDEIAKGLDEGAYFGFMGDAHDVMSPSNRRKYANANFYDNTNDWMEQKMAEDIDKLYDDVFKPTVGRWLWWLEGHHFWEFSDGTTTDTRLCNKLGAPFVGTCGFMRVRFVDTDEATGRNKNSHTLDIWAHHGAGGGTTVGAILNKLERVAGSFSADLYFMGHANRLGAVPKPLLELGGTGSNLYLKSRDRYLVATGAFDRGYQENSTAGLTGRPRGGYVEQGAMLPTGLGCPLVSVTPKVVSRGRAAKHSELDIKVTI